MKRIQLFWTAVVALAFVLPIQAQKEKKGDKKPAAERLDADQVLKPGQVSGKLAAAGANSVTLKIEYQHLELKPGAAKNAPGNPKAYQNLLREQRDVAAARIKVARAKNPAQLTHAIYNLQLQTAQLQQAAGRYVQGGGQNPFKVVTETANIDIQLATNVQVRTSFLANVYDDMGNPKKFTPQELKELKGPNANLPGYKAEITALKAGQKATITLAKNKETDNHVQATLVLITAESNEPVKPAKPPKKNK